MAKTVDADADAAGPGPGSGHAHGPTVSLRAVERQGHKWRLGIIAGAMGLVAILEVIGGVVTGSLALLADAAHASTDVGSVLLALYATHVAWKAAASPHKTFGYYRAEILAAFANAVFLVVLALFLVVEAIERLREPSAVDGLTVTAFAAAIAGAEAIGLVMLHRAQGESLNIRSAFLHLVGDLASTIGVALSGILIHLYGVLWVDPLITVAIAVLIVYWAYDLIRETSHILMEGSPREIDAEHVRRRLKDIKGVDTVHDLHVWTLTSGMNTMSAHVVADHRDPDPKLMMRVRARLLEDFGLEHVTIQLEDPEVHCGEAHD